MDDFEEFILEPFREVVHKGKIGVRYALQEDDTITSRAAQAAIEAGVDALDTVDPLCADMQYENDYEALERVKANGKPNIFAWVDGCL